MTVHRGIEIHPNGCVGWIIVMRLRILLITHYLIQEILVEVVFDIHVRDVRIKKFHDLYVVTMHLLYKGFVEKYHMLLTRP